MKEFFLKYLASNRLMTLLFFAFPAAMGLGTFIESWYSTDTAKIWIYNAWWFATKKKQNRMVDRTVKY